MQRVSGGLPAHCGAGSRASFAMLWLSFWLRDHHRRHHNPAADFASDKQGNVKVDPLVLAGIVSGVRLTIDLAASDVQPAGLKDEAILYSSEHDLITNYKFRPSKTNALSSNQ
jgi:hypothetical protein